MNWANGAFRVWVIFTVTWLGFVTWDIYGDSGPRIAELTNLMRKLELNDRDLQIKVEVIGDHRKICLSVGMPEGRSRFGHVYCDLPDLLLNQIDVKKLKKILSTDYSVESPARSGPLKGGKTLCLFCGQAEWNQAVAGLRYEDAKVYVAPKLRDSRSEAVREALWEFSLFGFLPPLGLLGSWFLGIWILRGFRPRT